MSKVWSIAAAATLALPLLATAAFVGSGALDTTASCRSATDPSPAGLPVNLTAAQRLQVEVIVSAARADALPAAAAVIATMTAYQETRLRNLANPAVPASLGLPHDGVGTNLDSLGLFQQRPSQDWGSASQLMTPSYAAARFMAALAAVPNWATMPAWQAAQAVQRSADGTLYAQWASMANDAVSDLWGSGSTGAGAATCSTTQAAALADAALPEPDTAAAAAAIAYARAQLGKPYQWGGTGPTGYDCSGLVYEAFLAAGITLPRTAEYMVDVGLPVVLSQLQPGDLVFFNLGEQVTGRPGHVGIYLGDGLMIDAPRQGEDIRIESVAHFGQYVGARRIVGAT